MTWTRKARRRPVVALSVTLGVVAVAALAGLATAAEPTATTASDEACPGAETLSVDTTVKEMRTSIRCRMNEERAIEGLGRLAIDPSLRKAANRHVKTMVATNCLAHKCPGEANLEVRIKKSGYLEGAEVWQYAENTGCGESVEEMIQSWLSSKFHRINLLNATFDDVGIGIAQEAVKGSCRKGFATFAVVFGHREP